MRRFDPVLFVSAVSGLLLTLAFPRADLPGFAWFALVPLFSVMRRRPFASGFTAGFCFFAGTLYWLNIVMTTYGGLQPLFSFLAYLFLVVYLACYFAIATWLACRLKAVFDFPPVLTLPCLWVALEYLRGILLTGFPWVLLGYSQHNFPLAIQSADVTGVYGVSFLLICVNAALAGVIAAPKKRRSWIGVAVVTMIAASHFGYGAWREAQPLDQRERELRVGLIQGNIDQARKWLPEQRQAGMDAFRELSRSAATEPLDLIIWPEAATPFFYQDPSDLSRQVREVAQDAKSALLFGSPSYRRLGADRYEYFNSAFLLSAEGRELGRSDKIHLVPFGEYVPLEKILTFIDKLVVGVGDFSPGQVRTLPLADEKLGVLICYEAIFPRLARDYVRRGSDLLVNLTNDAWFGRSAAPYQHLAMARFRAVENRVWLARAANTGVSAFISPRGRLAGETPIFATVYLTGEVGLGAQQTFYTRFGDVFACLCVLVGVVSGVALLLKKNTRPA